MEEQLPGGKTWGAVRIGHTVHRPRQPWTPAVHAVLRHLETAGFDGAPRVLGFDERGREILTFGHHDAGPYNAVWHDGRLVGFVDWDTAGPSPSEVDLAFVALSWVPLHARRVAQRHGFTAFDDRSRRLHPLLDAYGYGGDRSAFGTAVAARARRHAAGIHRLAAGGDPMYVALLPGAADLEQAAREVEALPASFWLRPNRSGYRRGPG